jgi:signal transduction histidine kinase
VRRRLIQSSVAVAVVAVLLLGVPLAVWAILVQRHDAQNRVAGVAQVLGRSVQERVGSGQAVTPALVRRLTPDAFAEVTLPSGQHVTTGRPPSGAVLEGVYRSGDGVTVRVLQTQDTLRRNILRTIGLTLAVALAAVVAGVAVGLLQGRRFTIPLLELADRAERVGSGRARPKLVPTGIDAVDRVAEMLEQSAVRVDRLIAAERQFASDASHQLRTPLTALSMRLEEILAADDPRTVREEARSALAQVERLATVVEHLLDNVRDNNLRAGPVPLDQVVLQQVVEWEPAFGKKGRRIVATGARGLIALATSNGLSQVIATLLENSLVHGAGTVTVSTRSTGISLVVEVTDEGPGVPPELGARIFERSVSGGVKGTGLGLAVARELAETDGGRLELVQQRPPVFALFLSSAAAGPR